MVWVASGRPVKQTGISPRPSRVLPARELLEAIVHSAESLTYVNGLAGHSTGAASSTFFLCANELLEGAEIVKALAE